VNNESLNAVRSRHLQPLCRGRSLFSCLANALTLLIFWFPDSAANAQQGPSGQDQPGSATSSSSNDYSEPASPGVAQATSGIPSEITVKLVTLPSTGSGFAGWSAIIVAVIMVIGSGGFALITAKQNKNLQNESQKKREEHELAIEELRRELAREELRQNQGHELTIEELRREQAREELRQKTGASLLEIEQAAWKIVHDQQVEEAKLIHLYFDKLTSSNPKEQDLALIAISAFIDSSVVERLASGGRETLSRSSLSRLAAGGSATAVSAQAALNRQWLNMNGSIVRVRTKRNEQEDQQFATGFFATSDLIVTLAVTEQGKDIYFDDGPNSNVQVARCVAVDEKRLIMAAKVEQSSTESPLILRRYPIQWEESPVNGTLVQRTDEGEFIARFGTVSNMASGSRSSGDDEGAQDIPDLIKVHVLSEPGTGGAPLFDEQSFVIGVIVDDAPGLKGKFPSMTGTSYAVDFTVVSKLKASAQASQLNVA
jgi:hypothetical protein